MRQPPCLRMFLLRFWRGVSKVMRALGVMRTPEMPSIEETQSHKETHIPFRSWCSVCIQAKSRQLGSKRVEKAPGEVLIIQADYCFPALEPI